MENATLKTVFDELYNQLNEEQKKAVDQLDGPVMVIAGPGTGKTQMLSARIGKILSTTDTLPSNILCLTFTESGAKAMQKRLLQFLGPLAYQVQIHTFHSFCNKVIQENTTFFKNNDLEIISDLEKTELFKTLLDGVSDNNPLKRFKGKIYYYSTPLQTLFKNIKKENLSPELLVQRLENQLANMHLDEQYIYKQSRGDRKKGDIKTDLLNSHKEQIKKLIAAINQYHPFQTLMNELNRYDFDDMLRWVIEIFEQRPFLLQQYQEQFLYFLIDEFQDTNGQQNKLIDLLTSFWNKPDIFVVGDDDQSIMRFQGASVENMKTFQTKYRKDLFEVVLQKNYRSTQPILDAAKQLIDVNQERLTIKDGTAISKKLVSMLPNHDSSEMGKPCIEAYETPLEEKIGIVEKIKNLIRHKQVPPANIAVIAFKNEVVNTLHTYLQIENIPSHCAQQENVLQNEWIRQILQILKYINTQHQHPHKADNLLFEILHYKYFKLQPLILANWMVRANELKQKEQKKNEKTHRSLRETIYYHTHPDHPTLFPQPADQQLKQASEQIEEWIADALAKPLPLLIEQIVHQSGLLNHILHQNDQHHILEVLGTFYGFVETECKRKNSSTLSVFINTIELMEKLSISLPLTIINGAEKGVNLITAHKSKGLEFEYVFIINATADMWEQKNKKNDEFHIPENVLTTNTTHPIENSEEEVRRLFYVAITRAKRFLNISYSQFKEDGKQTLPSRFMSEMQTKIPLPTNHPIVAESNVDSLLTSYLRKTAIMKNSSQNEEFIRQLVDNFTMNVTALNNYLECPIQFYYQNLIKIPGPKAPDMIFGSAVHSALQKLFEKMRHHPANEFPSEAVLASDFEYYLQKNTFHFTPTELESYIRIGRTILDAYYQKKMPHLQQHKIVSIEQSIQTTIHGIPIKGKIDKIEYTGNSIVVVDYKTGSTQTIKPKMAPPDEKNPSGGNYWRQAVMYKLLFYTLPNKHFSYCVFEFLESYKTDKPIETKIEVTAADETTLVRQIIDTTEKINAHQFEGCNKPSCTWCNFHKQFG